MYVVICRHKSYLYDFICKVNPYADDDVLFWVIEMQFVAVYDRFGNAVRQFWGFVDKHGDII